MDPDWGVVGGVVKELLRIVAGHCTCGCAKNPLLKLRLRTAVRDAGVSEWDALPVPPFVPDGDGLIRLDPPHDLPPPPHEAV